jgi:hypothetical protein
MRVMLGKVSFSGRITVSITLPGRMSLGPEGRYTGLGLAGRSRRLPRHRSCRSLKKRACIIQHQVSKNAVLVLRRFGNSYHLGSGPR